MSTSGGTDGDKRLCTSTSAVTVYRKCNQNTAFSDSKSSIYSLSMFTSGGTGDNSQR